MEWSSNFQLPINCQINVPVTKVSLKQQDNIIASEVKLLDNVDIQSIRIFGLLSTSNSNIEEYVDSETSFLEIYFILIKISSATYQKHYKPIGRLIHKLIPHHCVIVTQSDDEDQNHISLYTKTIHRNSPKLRVLDKEILSNGITKEDDPEFFDALKFEKANKLNLKDLYLYHKNILKNFNLMDTTKEFKIRNYERTKLMLEVQDEIQQYTLQINALQKDLKTTTQMSQKVAINTEIHGFKKQIDELKNKIDTYGKD